MKRPLNYKALLVIAILMAVYVSFVVSDAKSRKHAGHGGYCCEVSCVPNDPGCIKPTKERKL